jgi:hypothetical protein
MFQAKQGENAAKSGGLFGITNPTADSGTKSTTPSFGTFGGAAKPESTGGTSGSAPGSNTGTVTTLGATSAPAKPADKSTSLFPSTPSKTDASKPLFSATPLTPGPLTVGDLSIVY